MSKRRNHPLLERVEIEGIAAEGKALARVDGKVVFVPQAIPGDVVDIQVTRRRQHFLEGRAIRYHRRSPLRVEPFCEHFGLCGGCQWQHLPYSKQLEFKQQQVADQLARIGRVELPPLQPIIGSQATQHYRNKLEFTFSCSRWLTQAEIQSGHPNLQHPVLGFHVPGMFDKIFHVQRCHLQPEPSNAIRLAVGAFAQTHGYPYFDIRQREGLLRNLIIRTASTGDVMVILAVFAHDQPRVHALLDHLREAFPQITSLMYVVNPKPNDTIHDLEVLCYHGQDHITETLEGIRFRIGPKSFFQTNPAQAYELFRVTRQFAQLTGAELVYDLYTGTGTIANFLARSCRRVVGIESVSEAIADARANATMNGIANAHFVAGDAREVLTDPFLQAQGRPDVVILDPPRAGVHADVLGALVRADPRRVVYVSCNPATQARDVALLAPFYRVTRVQPVDMFPHTHHVENVVLLEKR